MSATYQHKRGNTLLLSGQVTVTQGGEVVSDLTGWSGASQLRDPEKGTLIATLTFAWVDASSRLISLSCNKSLTAAWPLGQAALDIKLTDPSGNSVSTVTQTILIVKEVTQ